MDLCPCRSNSAYADCCQPLVKGKRQAQTAEQLMRSRYAAYVKVETDYIFDTTHPEHRKDYDHKGTKEWAESSEWEGLKIVEVSAGGSDDHDGTVEFVARYRDKGERREHQEIAQFKKEKGKWFFTEGKMAGNKPIISSKVGRNEPCTCGSGQKYKKCCGK